MNCQYSKTSGSAVTLYFGNRPHLGYHLRNKVSFDWSARARGACGTRCARVRKKGFIISMRRTFYWYVIGVLCAAAPGASGQIVSGFGEVSGKVSDTQNVGIPDTTVAVFNDSLSVQRTMTTTDDGMFDAAALVPAKGYKLEVTRKNFEKWESGEFEVVLGRPVNFRITLLMEKEPPPDNAPSPRSMLNEKTYDIYESLDQLDIESLPSPTRRVASLALLTPGTAEDNDTGHVIFHGVRSTPALLIGGTNPPVNRLTDRMSSCRVTSNRCWENGCRS